MICNRCKRQYVDEHPCDQIRVGDKVKFVRHYAPDFVYLQDNHLTIDQIYDLIDVETDAYYVSTMNQAGQKYNGRFRSERMVRVD